MRSCQYPLLALTSHMLVKRPQRSRQTSPRLQTQQQLLVSSTSQAPLSLSLSLSLSRSLTHTDSTSKTPVEPTRSLKNCRSQNQRLIEHRIRQSSVAFLSPGWNCHRHEACLHLSGQQTSLVYSVPWISQRFVSGPTGLLAGFPAESFPYCNFLRGTVSLAAYGQSETTPNSYIRKPPFANEKHTLPSSSNHFTGFQSHLVVTRYSTATLKVPLVAP